MTKAKKTTTKKAKAEAAPASEPTVAAPVEAAPAPAPEPAAPAMVACRLGPTSNVGRLIVGRVVIERNVTGRIPRPEFERLKREYDLIEVEE